MKLKAIVEFTATSEIEFDIDEALLTIPTSAVGEAWEWKPLQNAVAAIVKKDGLPEVLRNDSIELVSCNSIEVFGKIITEGAFARLSQDDDEAPDYILLEY
jgi:hypothetical protein